MDIGNVFFKTASITPSPSKRRTMCSFTTRRGVSVRWTQIHLLNIIKEGTRRGESAAPFDFVYVLEIASPLQLAWLSV